MTEILTHPEVDQDLITIPFEDIDASEGDKFAHMINPAMNQDIQYNYGRMNARQIVDTARFLQAELVALCGYRFVPKHNPGPLKTCEECARIAGIIISEDG